MAPERHVSHPAVGIKFQQAGVSLLEFVIGLVLLAIILLGVTLFFASQHRQLDPVFQFRAVSLAEALAEQVLTVKYDHNNQPYQQTRCGIPDSEGNSLACKNRPSDFTGMDIELKNFTSVDDFQLWCSTGLHNTIGPIKGDELARQLDLPRTELYQRFTVETCVTLDDSTPDIPFKQVSIKVGIDSDASLSFRLQRYNIL